MVLKSMRCVAALLVVGLVAGLTSADALAQVRAGYEFPYAAESPHPYPTGTGTTPAWSLQVEHADATYVAIHFDRFDLAPGDRLVIRSPNGRQRHVLTERGRHGLGTFWAPHIKGDTAVLELMSPGRNPGGWGVSIDSYAAGVADMGSEDGATEAICGADNRRDAMCYLTSEPVAYDKSRAVARLLINGTLLCTGWLVGCEGHLLTNNHCIDDFRLGVDPATAVANTDYEFMAESVCDGGSASGLVWAGTPTLIQRDFGLDYAYIHLAGNPQSTYGSYTLDNRPPVADERIYIPQHPSGRPKEIALTSTDPTDESGFCEITQAQSAIKCTGGGPGDVTYQCDSQGGSSGSPVVAYASQAAIALHHCSLLSGEDPICPNLGVPITAIVNDLGENLPQCAILDAFTEIVYEAHSLDDDDFGNNNGVAEPFEIVNLAVDLHNDGNYQASGVSAVLSTATPGVTILDDTADWPTVPSSGTVTSLPPHFQVQLDPSVPCSTVMDFDLAITTDAGPFSASFQEMVGSTPGGSGTYDGVDTPLPIPDNFPQGVISTAPVSDSFSIGVITVSVDISHTRIGDLLVELISPMGITVRLHDGSGGGQDDIVTTYDTLTTSDGPGSMADFIGEGVNGNWRLKVVDTGAGNVGTINSWSLYAAQSSEVVCDPVPCEVTAVVSATPDTVCPGDPVLLADAGSFAYGEDCSGTLEYQFKLFFNLLQDWSTDPDVEVNPTSTASYTLRARDPVTLAEGAASAPIIVVQPPVASAAQDPDPMCVEAAAVNLDAGPGFVSYTWRDDLSQVVGTGQILALDATACGRTYSVEVDDGGGCGTDTANLEVQCQTCAPLEVSPSGSPVPLRMDVDGLGTMEFELQPVPGVVYHLYQAADVSSFLAGDWTNKFCDLAAGASGTWTPVNATTVRWTPTDPQAVLDGYWVVVAENFTVEGPYGFMTGGSPRPADSDGAGSAGNFGCP